MCQCIHVYQPMGYGSCVVQHLEARGSLSVGMPIYLINTGIEVLLYTQHSKPEIVWFLLNGSFVLPCTGNFQCMHLCTPVCLLLAAAWAHATSTCAQSASLSCATYIVYPCLEVFSDLGAAL